MAIAFFESPGLSPATAWRATLNFLELHDIASEVYFWGASQSRRHQNRDRPEIMSGQDILTAMEADEASGFGIYVHRGRKSQVIYLSAPSPRFPWQQFNISSQIPGLRVSDWSPLLEQLAWLRKLALAVMVDFKYRAAQQCTDPNYYAEQFGSTEGLRIIRVPPDPPFPERLRIDITTNPGRIDQINGGPAMVAADMWLGPSFWQYAPCKREEILAQPWVMLRDTEHFLYVKTYEEPFNRPDGEQGEIQRRLWQLLFHLDCQWPPTRSTVTV